MTNFMKIYNTYIGCTQDLQACPTDGLEMVN